VAGVTRIQRPPRDVWPAIAAMGILDTLGFMAYSMGIVARSVAIIGTLSGLLSAVTAGLAAIFLRERLTRVQYARVAAIFLGRRPDGRPMTAPRPYNCVRLRLPWPPSHSTTRESACATSTGPSGSTRKSSG
jgi:uncharacterized protein YeaC (DUF1315 family)